MNNAAVALAYLDRLEQQDLESAASLLAEEAIVEIPLSNTGDLAPWFTFTGKAEALAYVETIFANFSQVHLLDRVTFISDDGSTIFIETNGDLIQRTTSASYRNRYVFKFTIVEGLVKKVIEYTNPVPFSKLMGIPLG